MADEIREVLLKIDIDTAKSQKELLENERRVQSNIILIGRFKRILKSTPEEFKRITDAITKLNQKNRELRTVNRALQKDIEAEAGSLNLLRRNVVKLVKARNAVNKTTEVGVKDFATLNKEILKQNELIKRAEEGGGDFRRSVGNYQKALDGGRESLRALSNNIPILNGGLRGISQNLLGVNDRLDEFGNRTSGIFSLIGNTVRELFTFIKSLGVLRLALIATGIGAFVLAFASLQRFFTGTKRGAEQLERITKKLGAAFAVVGDIVAAVGEVIAFVVESALDGVLKLIPALGEAAMSQEQITRRQQELADIERQLNVEREKSNAFIQEQLKITNNVTKSSSVRFKAAQNALNEETRISNEQIKLAQEKADLKKEENALNESTIEDLDEQKRLEAEVFEIRTRSATKQREILSVQKTLIREIAAEALKANAQIDQLFISRVKTTVQINNLLIDSNAKRLDREAADEKRSDDLRISSFVKSQSERARIFSNTQKAERQSLITTRDEAIRSTVETVRLAKSEERAANIAQTELGELLSIVREVDKTSLLTVDNFTAAFVQLESEGKILSKTFNNAFNLFAKDVDETVDSVEDFVALARRFPTTTSFIKDVALAFKEATITAKAFAEQAEIPEKINENFRLSSQLLTGLTTQFQKGQEVALDSFVDGLKDTTDAVVSDAIRGLSRFERAFNDLRLQRAKLEAESFDEIIDNQALETSVRAQALQDRFNAQLESNNLVREVNLQAANESISDSAALLVEQTRIQESAARTEIELFKQKSDEISKIEQAGFQRRAGQTAQFFGAIAGLAKEGSAKQQALQSAQAAISTFAAAAAALSPPPTGAGPVFGPLVAAAAVASGLGQVAKINEVTFADGGMVEGPSHAKGGVKFGVGGRVNELEGGEAVINKTSSKRFGSVLSAINVAGGGKRFQEGGITGNRLQTDIATSLTINTLSQRQAMLDAVRQSPRPIVEFTELNRGQDKLDSAVETSEL